MQISAIQTDVVLGDRAANLSCMERHIATEAANGRQLIIFPECFTCGYCFDSLDEAMSMGEPLDGESVTRATELCGKHQCMTVFGMLERDGENLFNVAVVVGPSGLIGSYRKVHLPYLGVDRFTTPGDRPFEVIEAGGVRIGLLICYDQSFPEATRSLALQGADIITLPTNWPPGSEYMSMYSTICRAMENGVYFAAVNRVGTEREFEFIGKSRICGPTGAQLAAADHTDEAVLHATIDVSRARTKRVVRVPGKHVIDRMADRRPEMYSKLCEPHNLPRPGRDEPA